MNAIPFAIQVHTKFVRMGAKFDAATKGEYADIQGESLIGVCIWRPAQKKDPKKLSSLVPAHFQTFHD